MADGLVFNVQRYSVQDGPGIRTTVFLKGCPLDCAWCHNPEGLSREPQIMTVETRCLRCGECLQACPHGEKTSTEPLPVNVPHCQWCGACIAACPTGSRQFVGNRMTPGEVFKTVLRDRIFYEESGGGVTFSGGEPLSQPEFLRETLSLCRESGIHTAVDTCGFAPLPHLLSVAEVTDLFLYDLKLINDAAHRQFTGQSNRLILENLRALAKRDIAIWLRIPVIPGVNDAAEDFRATAAFAASLGGVLQVNLLPYHASGVRKAERVGQANRLPRTEPPEPESLNQALEIFRSAGLIVHCGGGN